MSSALRQRVAGIARQARPNTVRNTRSYASESHGSHGHGHGHGHTVEEPLGPAFFITVGAIPVTMFVYSIGQPAENGEEKGLTKWFAKKVWALEKENVEQNQRTADLIQQAAADRHSLLYAPSTNGHHELKYPEIFQHGSPFNVPAGHGVNLDKVIAHYRKQHLDEEERKAKLAASK